MAKLANTLTTKGHIGVTKHQVRIGVFIFIIWWIIFQDSRPIFNSRTCSTPNQYISKEPLLHSITRLFVGFITVTYVLKIIMQIQRRTKQQTKTNKTNPLPTPILDVCVWMDIEQTSFRRWNT